MKNRGYFTVKDAFYHFYKKFTKFLPIEWLTHFTVFGRAVMA